MTDWGEIPDGDIVDETLTAAKTWFRDTGNDDPLSVPDIAWQQQEAERVIQGLSAVQYWAESCRDDAEVTYRTLLNEAYEDGRVPVREAGKALTADQRLNRALNIPEVLAAQNALNEASRRAKSVETMIKAMFARLSSLQSRLRAAVSQGEAHQRYGDG